MSDIGSPASPSPLRIGEGGTSPARMREDGTVLQKPKIDGFDYVGHQTINTRYILDYIARTLKPNQSIPKSVKVNKEEQNNKFFRKAYYNPKAWKAWPTQKNRACTPPCGVKK